MVAVVSCVICGNSGMQEVYHEWFRNHTCHPDLITFSQVQELRIKLYGGEPLTAEEVDEIDKSYEIISRYAAEADDEVSKLWELFWWWTLDSGDGL